MPDYLLRVEAVNLGAVIDDTDDLSTRRGGGLLALYAIGQMVNDPTNIPPTIGTIYPVELRTRLTPVATGASIGLFEFDAPADEANMIADQVREHFRTGKLEYHREDGTTGHLPLSVGTFAVDVVPQTSNHREDVERATAANRWRQLQEPTVSLEGLWGIGAKDSCHFDRVRPADTEILLPEGKTVLGSASVAARRKYGRGARQLFYRDVCGATCQFTDEFAQIAERETISESLGEELTRKLAPSNTANKLAVFYVDGNGFGGIGRKELAKADGLDAFRGWSKGVQDHHVELMRGLLARADKDESWWGVNNERKRAVRLETLLWGGDEIVWVVPAWKGWELAEHFFSHPHRIGDQNVTYSAGLVFCHVKAPIKNVVKLAKERLAEAAKTVGKKANKDEPPHQLAYEVLESFDDISGDLLEHREKWLPDGMKAPRPKPDNWPDPLTIDPSKLKDLLPHLRTIAGSDDFPTRQLYMLLKAWREGRPTDSFETRLNGSGVKGELVAVRDALGPTAWLHLLNMLPYIPAEAVA